MTQDEIAVLLRMQATLSEYEHFMSQLSLMIEKRIDVPLSSTTTFPMKTKLYGQVRDLLRGKSALVYFPRVGERAFCTKEPFWGEGTVTEVTETSSVLKRDDGAEKVFMNEDLMYIGVKPKEDDGK